MSAAWLAELAPAHAPPPPGWWPPAIGWWILAALAVLAGLAVAAAIKAWCAPHRRVRRAALRELKRIGASAVDGPAAAQAIESLMRRYAVARYGRARIARLTGRAWLDFARAAGAERLAGQTGRSLLESAFAERSSADRARWLAAAAEFIRRAPRASRLGR